MNHSPAGSGSWRAHYPSKASALGQRQTHNCFIRGKLMHMDAPRKIIEIRLEIISNFQCAEMR